MNNDIRNDLINNGYKKLCEVPYYVNGVYPDNKTHHATLTIWYRPTDELFAISSACPIGKIQGEFIYCSEDRLKACLSEFKQYMEDDFTISSYGFVVDPVKEADKNIKMKYKKRRKLNSPHEKSSWIPVKDLDDYSAVQEFTTDVLLAEVEDLFNKEGRALTLDETIPEDLDLIKTATDIVIDSASAGQSREEVINNLFNHMYDFTYSINI